MQKRCVSGLCRAPPAKSVQIGARQAEIRPEALAEGRITMRTHHRGKRNRLLIVVLFLLPIFGCAGVDRIGRGSGLRDDGAIAGRVQLVGSSGGAARDSDGRPAAANGPVFVYLEPGDASVATPPSMPTREIRIGAGRQEPALVLVLPNQPFRFLNLDKIHHEPFSLDAPNDFRVRIGGREPSDPIQLPQSGFVRAFCALHPAETFALIVSPAHHVVEVENDGSFVIENVQSGDYRVRAGGVDGESAAMPVRVSREATLKIQLRLAPRGAR